MNIMVKHVIIRLAISLDMEREELSNRTGVKESIKKKTKRYLSRSILPKRYDLTGERSTEGVLYRLA